MYRVSSLAWVVKPESLIMSMRLVVTHRLWSIIGDSGFVVSSVGPLALAPLSFHALTGNLGSRPLFIPCPNGTDHQSPDRWQSPPNRAAPADHCQDRRRPAVHRGTDQSHSGIGAAQSRR